MGGAGAAILAATCKPVLPPYLSEGTRDQRKRSIEFWIRLLFSALVDADFLDTEAFYDAGKSAARSTFVSIDDLKGLLDRHLTELARKAESTRVNEARKRILAACYEAAQKDRGSFSLTAPTGAGKTLAGMAFALEHAVRHGLQRIIVVLPFTSIIEQSARTYRGVFGDEAVIEHHSNLDPDTENHLNRLASENWDAPIIVTTTVQFFESLFGNRSSACRKLHSIANSVVVLDEAQAIPTSLLLPILDGLRELTANYGATLLISTATQPAFRARDSFPGLPNVQEIVPSPQREFDALRRVTIEWPRDPSVPTSWEGLAEELSRLPCFLAIVHKRADARELARLLGGDAVHLSASMCASHRFDVIKRITAELKARRPIWVVSTQLVEAGVDVDFPVVYRALAGLDALAQSAGRCNREGSLETGRFVVFVPSTEPPRGVLRSGRDITRELLARDGISLDPLSPLPFDEYFRKLYFVRDLDKNQVQADRESFNFKTVAENFRVIEAGGMTPVVVPYADARDRIERLRREGASRHTLRRRQPFLVTVYERDFARLKDAGAVELVAETVWSLKGAMKGSSLRDFFADEDRAQRNTVALREVDYVIDAHFEMTEKAGPDDNLQKFIEMFSRRVEKGQAFNQPYLGCREFSAEFLPATDAPTPIDETRDLGPTSRRRGKP
jgi:CRISPR-associated endonuclease/helicase Cas3